MKQNNYLKNLIKTFIWPMLFAIGQFLIIFFFTLLFNVNYLKDLKQEYPQLNQIELQEKLNDKIGTVEYQKQLNTYYNDSSIYMVSLSFLILFPILYIYYKKRKRKAKKIEKKKLPYIMILSISLALSLNLLIYLLNLKWHITNHYDNTTILLTTLISTCILGPIIEELLFRGLVYENLKSFNSKKFSILVTSFMFSFFHVEPTQMIYAFLIGLFLNILYEEYHNIKIPIFAHMLINLSTTLIIPFVIKNNIVFNIIAFILLLSVFIFFVKKMYKQKEIGYHNSTSD